MKITKRMRKKLNGPSHAAQKWLEKGHSHPQPIIKHIEEMGINKPIIMGYTKGVPYVNKENFL